MNVPANNEPTIKDVAVWMAEKFDKAGELYQDAAVTDIELKFGKDFVYSNENGNLAIDRGVLREFRKLTEKTAVWERGNRYWRKRAKDDDPDKRQAE